MKISRMAKVIEPSLSRKLYNLAKEYDHVLDLTLGDPDLVPNEKIREAACKAVMEGRTRYSANAGLADLREKIGACFTHEYGLQVDAGSEIVVTVGGMEALFLSLACLIDEGDEVIVHAPYYVNYIQMIRMCGGKPVIINTYEENGFSLTKEQIEAAVTDKTVALILNTPCNPTGVAFSGTLLDEIAEIVLQKDLMVISDEVYRILLYDGISHESIMTRPGMKAHTVLVDSMSKRFAMTGYRIGYVIAPQEMAAYITNMQENVAACAPLPSQYAGITAYSECESDDEILRRFSERRAYMYEAINEIEGLHCRKPEGTFYLFVNIRETGLDCVTFAYRLLEAQQVAVVPGVTYGEAYRDYIRIAYTLDIEELKKAVARIGTFVKSLKG